MDFQSEQGKHISHCQGEYIGSPLHMQHNNAGEMIQKWWLELENKFPNITIDEFIIMPNHFHGIIQINTQNNSSLSTMIQWFKTMITNEYIRGVKT